MKNIIALSALLFAQAALSQAPATAPAGASGICKDGTYSTAASKDGACRGHKGVQTWYKASTPSLPAPTPGSTASAPAPTPRQPASSAPAPKPGTASSLPAPAPAPAPPSQPAPRAGSTLPSQPVPGPAPSTPSLPAPKPGIADQHARLSTTQPAPGGGPGLVWVNTASKVYHCPGSDFYGKTKAGSYMSESAAKAEGDRPNRNKPCS